MDADRLMFHLLQQMQAFGTDPLLADILTDENIRQSHLIKDCVDFLTDVDVIDDYVNNPELIMSQAWTLDFVRGLGLGILVALETDNSDPVDFKAILANMYKQLESLRIEKTFDSLA